MYQTSSIKSVYITSLSEKPYKVLIYCHPNHVQILAYCLPSILLPSGKTYQAGFKLNIQKAKTNLDRILKSRDINLPTQICLVKAMIFSVVMYECKSWTIKKAEHRRIDAFELW